MRLLCWFLIVSSTLAAAAPATKGVEDISRAEKNIQISKVPNDQQIAKRLLRILTVTGWFTELRVECQEGIVTLNAEAKTTSQSEWAENLARDTDGVVAVINQIKVAKPRWFDLAPAQEETEGLVKHSVAFIPYLLTSIFVMVVFSFLGIAISAVARQMMQKRTHNVLLVDLGSRLAGLPIFILGLYMVLQVCGLTGIAVTVLGGTGAFGLIAGFAMQNILANYFAGIMLSLRNPYTVGDVITVAGQTGVVQKLTTRGTILVDFDGNLIIIPNSTIYNSIIVNQSLNPKTRVKFNVGIGFNDSTTKARTAILQILTSSKGVLKDPEPSCLVSDFLPSMVQVSVFFWISSNETSGDKLKSVILERVKETLTKEGFHLPADIHQVSFPRGIPQLGLERSQGEMRDSGSHHQHAEIQSDNQELLRQASEGRNLELGRDLKSDT